MCFMECNEKLVARITIGLVFSSILLVLVLYCTKVIDLGWIDTVILISIAALLLLMLFEYSEKKPSNKLLVQLKSDLSSIKVSSNKILKELKHQQSIINKLEREIQRCDDEEGLKVFLHLKYCNKELRECWREYIKCVERHYKLQVEFISKYIVNKDQFDKITNKDGMLGKFGKYLVKLHTTEIDNAFDRFKQFLSRLVDARAVFEDGILQRLEERRPIIGELYKRNYITCNVNILSYLNDWVKSSINYSSCIGKIMDDAENVKQGTQQQNESTKLSSDIMLKHVGQVKAL